MMPKTTTIDVQKPGLVTTIVLPEEAFQYNPINAFGHLYFVTEVSCAVTVKLPRLHAKERSFYAGKCSATIAFVQRTTDHEQHITRSKGINV